jgi:hypothetical protein
MMSLLTVPYCQGVHVMQDLVCDVCEKLEIHFEGNVLSHALVPAGHARSFLHTFETIVRVMRLFSQISRF